MAPASLCRRTASLGRTVDRWEYRKLIRVRNGPRARVGQGAHLARPGHVAAAERRIRAGSGARDAAARLAGTEAAGAVHVGYGGGGIARGPDASHCQISRY